LNIQEYISSGVIEAVALGIATEEERATLQRLSLQHPEIKQILEDHQHTLEKYASLHAVKPPDHLRDDIWRMVSQANAHQHTYHASTPIKGHIPKQDNAGNSRVISLPRYAIASSLALFVCSIAANIFLAVKSSNAEAGLARLSNEKTNLVNERNRAVALQHQSEETLSGLIDPAVKPILLNGTGTHSYCKAIVYWNSNSKDVFLSLTDLPAAPAGKQYQLWAIIDGKPVDAGMYERKEGLLVLKMKKVDHAQMFAITLENAGGSDHPTLDQMFVAGSV